MKIKIQFNAEVFYVAHPHDLDLQEIFKLKVTSIRQILERGYQVWLELNLGLLGA